MLQQLKNVIPAHHKQTIKGILQNFFIDYSQSVSTSIILSSVPRSGSTWVGDVINHSNDYRYIFEVFHPKQVSIWQKEKLPVYLSNKINYPYFDSAIKNILLGKIRSRWTDKFNHNGIYTKRLLKEVYANLLLKGIKIRFPEVPIVLLFRHPSPTALSQINIIKEEPILKTITHCFNDQALIDEHIAFFMPEFKKAKTTYEKCVFYWCVQYFVPLKQFKEGEIHLAFYENFCQDPGTEIKRLFNFLDIPYTKEILKKLKIPSNTCLGNNHAINTGENLVESWKKNISQKNLERTHEILSLFGLDKIYGKNSMPNINAAYDLLKKIN